MAIGDLFTRQLVVINVGLEIFAEALGQVGARVIHVAWTPPAGGDGRLAALLASIQDEEDDA